MFILVLEVNWISSLSPNHTLQLITLRTSVIESLQLHFKNMILLWWVFRRCSVVTISARDCMLFDICRCDLFQRHMISDGLGSLPSGCLMQLANKPLSLQLVCNYGNHSVAKTANLFSLGRTWASPTLVSRIGIFLAYVVPHILNAVI